MLLNYGHRRSITEFAYGYHQSDRLGSTVFILMPYRNSGLRKYTNYLVFRCLGWSNKTKREEIEC